MVAMLTFDEIKNRPTELLALTSLTLSEFIILLAAFRTAWDYDFRMHTAKGKVRDRRGGSGVFSKHLATVEDKLLFILYFDKLNPIQTALAIQFGMTQPKANKWIHRLLPILREAEAQLNVLPTRIGAEVAKHPFALEGVKPGARPSLSIDGTDRPIQRSGDDATQELHYSGKQKTHTDKNIVVVNQLTKKIVFLGKTEPGSVHDKKMIDQDAIKYPPETDLFQDTGFQGYKPENAKVHQPKKNRKAKGTS
jgi:hypothetical protein